MTKEEILSIIEQETDQKCTEETSLEELGVDSLELLNLLQAIEQHAGIAFPDERIGGLVTVGDILDLTV